MSSTPESFAELGLSDSLLKTLSEIGYETPSPIQAQCIPVLLEGRDLIGQAQTGTGKTAAFALPLIALATWKNVGFLYILAYMSSATDCFNS